MRESVLDRALTEYAKREGWVSIKLTTLGYRGAQGWPDRLFLGQKGEVVFMELKSPGRRPTALQAQRIAELQERGFLVYVVDSLKDGAQKLDEAQARAEG